MIEQKDLENVLKVFGITNQMLEVELNKVEKSTGISLGRTEKNDEDLDSEYYPQFDEEIRNEAEQMAKHYELFYCLEKTIRSLISEQIEAIEGSNWWDTNRIPQAVKDNVNKTMKREIDSGFTLRSNDPLDFTTFGELSEIIKSNWDIFGAIFNSQRAVEKVMANLNMLRGPIAHCSQLAGDEVLRLQLSMRDWFRLME